MTLSFGSSVEQLRDQLQPVLLAEPQIEKGGVEASFLQMAQRLRAGGGLVAFVPKRVERDGGGFADVGFVVDDKNAQVNHRRASGWDRRRPGKSGE